jgi:hypothetical protein
MFTIVGIIGDGIGDSETVATNVHPGEVFNGSVIFTCQRSDLLNFYAVSEDGIVSDAVTLLIPTATPGMTPTPSRSPVMVMPIQVQCSDKHYQIVGTLGDITFKRIGSGFSLHMIIDDFLFYPQACRFP